MINHDDLDVLEGKVLNRQEAREITSIGLEIINKIKNLPANADVLLGIFCGIYANADQLEKELTEIAMFTLFLRAQEYIKGKIDAGEIMLDTTDEEYPMVYEEDPENDFREV